MEMATMRDERACVLLNENVGPALYVLTLKAPRLASAIAPGQFVHMQIAGMDDHILRRPFSIYARNVSLGTIEILYQVVGYGTDVMTRLSSGQSVSLIGPCGRGWQPPDECQRALLVGGGVGAAPLFLLAESFKERGVPYEVVLGAQTADGLVTHDRYASLLERKPRASTDDGSFGFAGFCTPLVEAALAEAAEEGHPFDYLAVCGPEPLMRLASAMGLEAGILTEVSLERRMACGIGACLSCVAQTTFGPMRVCSYGPVFDASEVVW